MVLEATLICLDNSEWMRNGDYAPTRLDAQYDAASIICNDRTTTNPENTVGIISMAGQGVELLVSPTEDIGKILACFAKIKLGGKSDFGTTVQIAQLALKHRKNKNGGQRIVAFVGSPINDNVEVLAKIGKQLKKNNVAVDIISLGEVEENQDKLTAFIESVNSSDNSHLINVPSGVAPSDAILSSPLMQDSPYAGMGGSNMGGTGLGAAGTSNFDEFGGIDPAMDPELAMAIRVSTEEARALEEARTKSTMEESKSSASASATTVPASTSSSAIPIPSITAPVTTDDDDDDEAALVQRALELSMRESTDETTVSSNVTTTTTAPSYPVDANGGNVDNDDDMDEDEALRRALELSMVSSPPDATSSSSSLSSPSAAPIATSSTSIASSSAPTGEFGNIDPDFLNALLGSNDVDMNDPLIQAALAQLTGTSTSSSSADSSKESRKRKNDNDGGGGSGNDDKKES